MKTKKLILAITVLLACTLLSSCAQSFALFKHSSDSQSVTQRQTDKPDVSQYTEAAEGWVRSTLSDYAHREYSAGDDVDDINILYLGYRYCLSNADTLDDVITSGSEEYLDTISISGAAMERICRNLIASDFTLSDYHSYFENNYDKYYSSDDLYVFQNGRDYWCGDNYNATGTAASALANGSIAVSTCVYCSPNLGEAEDFRMLEYIVEPIDDGKNVYFRLNQITDKGSVEDLTKTAAVDFSVYQNLNDLTYSDSNDGKEWHERPVIVTAKLTVPMTWLESGNEILSFGTESSRYIRCLQFGLIKVDDDYTLNHDIHKKLHPHEEDPSDHMKTDSPDSIKEYSGHSSAGYDYISYSLDKTYEDNYIEKSEQRYYRVSDEYVLSVYFSGDKETSETAQTALDSMIFEIK